MKKKTEQLILLALEDITDKVHSEKILRENEARIEKERSLLHDFFTQAPAILAILKGPEFIFEFANPAYMDFIGNRNIIGKTLLAALPEVMGQGFIEMLEKVYKTGETFTAVEMPVQVDKGNKKLEQFYMNFTYKAFTNDNGETEGILIFGYEVTELVNSRKQIEANEVQSRNIIDSSPDCLKILDIEGRIQYINFNGICQMEIDDFSIVKNKHWWDFWGHENEDTLKAAVDKALAGETAHFSAFCPTVKGKPKWWDVVVSPLAISGEGVQQIVALSRDVTERKTAEKLIQASEEKFRTLSETIPHMIWTATPDGNKNFFNKYYLDYTGMSFEELKNGGMKKIIFPADRKKDLQHWSRSLKTGEDFNMEKRIRRHDGVYRWHLSHGRAQKDSNGKVTGWIGTSTEIEEQKKFTEELEANVKERTEQLQLQNQTFELAESVAKLGSYRWNLTTNVLEYSDNLFRLFDCQPQEFEPTFEKFLTYIHPEDLDVVIKNEAQTLQTGKVVETPYRIISKSGKIKHFRSSGKFSNEGSSRLLIGTIQDVGKDIEASENLKAANTRLKKTVEELKQTNQQLEQFANAASHDLQEPLRKIINFSMRIQDKYKENLSEEVKIYLDKIVSASKRMTNLIKDLLNYSLLLDNEKLFSKVNLNDTLTTILNDFELRITEKKAVIQSESLPTIDAITLQMNQLFYNLIGNALKFTKDNVTPTINITSRTFSNHEIKNYPALVNLNPASEHQSYIEIIVKDNGIGFDQQYDKQIFTIFQRLHDSGTYQGTGIGLALCKKIIENHDGEIFVIAEENKGAEFHIILPIN